MFFELIVFSGYVDVADKDGSLGPILLDDGLLLLGWGLRFGRLVVRLLGEDELWGFDPFGDNGEKGVGLGCGVLLVSFFKE
jgi:hypothetical protein